MDNLHCQRSFSLQPLSRRPGNAASENGDFIQFGGRFIREEYVKARQLRGVSLSSKGSVYTKQDEWHKKEGTCVPDLSEDCNQLCKSQLREEGSILKILKKYADKKPWHCWISDSLPADLNLPVSKSLTCRTVQVFFIGEERPLFVLSLHEHEKDASEIERYTVDTVRRLSWRLLDFCGVDLIVLPCTLMHARFNLKDLQNEVCRQQASAEVYFRGPMVLSSDSFGKLKAAATALTGASVVPCLLSNPQTKKPWQLVMDTKWRTALSQVIEAACSNPCLMQSNVRFYPDDEGFKAKATAIEAAKRLSAKQHILLASSDTVVIQSTKMLRGMGKKSQPELQLSESGDPAEVDRRKDARFVFFVDWNSKSQLDDSDENTVLENKMKTEERASSNRQLLTDESNHIEHLNRNRALEITELVKRNLWDSVDEKLDTYIDAEVVRIVSEVGKYVNDNEFVILLSNHCSPAQLELILPVLVNEQSWAAVDAVLRKGVSETLHRSTVTHALKQAKNTDLVQYILPNCSGNDVINYVIPVFSHDQVAVVLGEIVRRSLWRAAGFLLEKDIEREQREWLVQKAISQADHVSLINFIFPNCSKEQLKSTIEELAKRSMWQTIAVVLQCLSGKERQWGTGEGGFRQTEENIIQHILPLCKQEDQDLILPALVEGRFWRAVAVSLRRVECSSTLQKWAVKEAVKYAEVKHIHAILPFCLDEELDSVLSHLVTRGYWRESLAILKRGRLGEQVRNWAVQKACSECKDIELLTQIIGFCPKDALVKLAQRLVNDDKLWPMVCNLFKHHAADDLNVSKLPVSCPRYRAMDVDLQQFLDHKSTSKMLSRSSLQMHMKIPPLVRLSQRELFKRIIFPQLDPKSSALNETLQEEKPLLNSSSVLKGLSANPSFPILQQASIEQLVSEGKWDEISTLRSSLIKESTRRWLFKEAVRSGMWETVMRFGDQNLYDDQRGWAIDIAVRSNQWTVALALADDGLDTVETTRLPYRMLRRFKEEVKQQEKHTISKSIIKAAAKKQWSQVLFWIQERPHVQLYKKIAVDAAVKAHAWHIVTTLVRLGLEMNLRDSLFRDMLKQCQFGVCRVLLEQRVSTGVCLGALDTFLKQRQWVLVARVMEHDVDDDTRRTVIKQAMEAGEGSVVWHCIRTMEEPLSAEEREKIFNQAASTFTWQAVKAFVGERDTLGLKHRETAAIEAIAHKQWDVVDYCLLQNEDLCKSVWASGTCLSAAMLGDWDMVEQLVNRGVSSSLVNSAGESLLHFAINAEAWSTVMFLIKFQANIHQEDRYGRTPLSMLIDARRGDAIDLALYWCPDLQKGRNKCGETALHAVCLIGHWNTMYYLIARGVDPLAVTTEGQSVLGYAVQNEECPQRMVAECIKLGLSTHQTYISDTFSDLISPFELSLLRDMPVLTHMLYESGSCSYRELYRLYEYYQTPIMTGARLPRKQLPYITSVATNPRSLSSLCRIVISHSLNVRGNRRRDIQQLPLTVAAKRYVMFSDLIGPYCAA